MLGKCRAIVIRSIDFSESSVVLKCYTDKFGMQSYLVNGVRGKKSAIRPSHVQVLNLLELESYHQQNKNLQRIKELKCEPLLKSIHYDFKKSSIGVFIAELINKCIKEENHPDENLFDFLFHTIQILDLTDENVALLAPYFMLQLSKYLGFFPKNNYSSQNDAFDLKEGFFRPHDNNMFGLCSSEISLKIYELLNSDFENLNRIELSKDNRSEIIEVMIKYYQFHISDFKELNSYVILKGLFSAT